MSIDVTALDAQSEQVADATLRFQQASNFVLRGCALAKALALTIEGHAGSGKRKDFLNKQLADVQTMVSKWQERLTEANDAMLAADDEFDKSCNAIADELGAMQFALATRN